MKISLSARLLRYKEVYTSLLGEGEDIPRSNTSARTMIPTVVMQPISRWLNHVSALILVCMIHRPTEFVSNGAKCLALEYCDIMP